MPYRLREEEVVPRLSQQERIGEIFLPPDHGLVALEPDLVKGNDLDASTREPTKLAPPNFPNATHAQEEEHLPEPHSSQQESGPVADDQEGSHTLGNCLQSPPSSRVERSPGRDSLEESIRRRPITQQPQSALVTDLPLPKAQQLLAEYAKLHQLPLLSVNLSTQYGRLQLLALMQDFALWMASNSGSAQRGNLGLEIPNLAAVFYPQYEGLNTMIMSKWSTQVPEPIRQRFDHVFSTGDMFWYRTSEYAADTKQQLGDKFGLTARGLLVSGWRLLLVVKVLPNMLLCCWGRTAGNSDLSKVNRRDQWQFARLLRSDRMDWPEDIEAKDSPHANIFMDTTNARGWPVQNLKDHCNFNVLVAQEVIPTNGYKYAGRLEEESHKSVDWIRSAFYLGMAVMPEAPRGVNVAAVRRGIENIRTPWHPPIVPKRVGRDSFPTADEMSPLSTYVPPPVGHAPVYKDPAATPHIPRGPRGATEPRLERDWNNNTGRRLPARSTYGQDPDRQRSRSRSRSPRDSQDGRFRDYARRRPPPPRYRPQSPKDHGKTETRGEPDHQPEDYDRSESRGQHSPTRRHDQSPDLRQGHSTNNNVFNAYKMGEAKAVVNDNHNGDRQHSCNAANQVSYRDGDDDRGRGGYRQPNRD